eukprot:scaffold122773_cov45-Attheya_sp.AAC.4
MSFDSSYSFSFSYSFDYGEFDVEGEFSNDGLSKALEPVNQEPTIGGDANGLLSLTLKSLESGSLLLFGCSPNGGIVTLNPERLQSENNGATLVEITFAYSAETLTDNTFFIPVLKSAVLYNAASAALNCPLSSRRHLKSRDSFFLERNMLDVAMAPIENGAKVLK